MSDININGPVNIIRLEGKINNIKKTIYIFGDVHLAISSQKQNRCIQDDRIDMEVFLANIFKKNTDINYDLFIESPPTKIVGEQDNTTKNYILNMRDFVSNHFNLDSSNNVIPSETYPNVRFHYFDIRNILGRILKIKDKLVHYTTESLDWTYDLRKNINIIVDYLSLLDERIKETFIKNKDFITCKEILKVIEKKRYTNDSIYCILAKKFEVIVEKIKEIDIAQVKINIRKKFNKHIKSTEINNYDFVFDVFKMIHQLSKNIEDLFSKTIDIYLLRRFLDKNYITNSIVYTGYAHFANIIHILINDFNFKITHATEELEDKSKLTKKIISKSSSEFISHMLNEISINLYVIQCSNFKNFPNKMN